MLVLVNALPIVGVVVWNWDVLDVVVLYWLETLIIGLLNLPKMAMAQEIEAERALPRLVLITLFILKFVGFCLVHVFLINHMVGNNEAGDAKLFKNPLTEFASLFKRGILTSYLAVIALFASHLFSFFWNYIGRREYREVTASQLLFVPYARFLPLQIVILFSAIAIQFFTETAMYLLLVLIAVKTVIDVGLHLYSHSISD